MSLTSFVSIPDVRERFREEFHRPRRPSLDALRVKSGIETRYSGRIGTAFDYLLRFAIEHHYPQAITRPWVAERGLEIVRELAGPTNSRSERSAIRRAERFMKRAKKDHATYLSAGKVTNDLLETVWRLAYLDAFYRASVPPSKLLERKEVHLGDGAAELRLMLRLTPIKSWKPHELLLLNPTFGDASLLVGGADADIIVDDTIIDIKTTKAPRAPREAFNQLIGYAALAEIGGVNGDRRVIQHFELYMARYGRAYHYDREEIIDEERWPLFLEWFEERAKQANTPEARQAAQSGGKVLVLLGNGDGSFQRQHTYTVGSDPSSVAVGDFTGDGVLDLAVANEGGTVSVLLGNGDGTFQPQETYPAGSRPFSVAVGDFTGDGVLDLAVATDGRVSVLLGEGDGTFAPAARTYPARIYPFSVAVGDFTGDGVLDLAVAKGGRVSVLLGKGDGSFRRAVYYGVGRGPGSVAVADFDGDGKPELVVTNCDRGAVSVLLGNGDGTFREAVNYDAGRTPVAVAVGDFNGDGVVDLAVANERGAVSVLLGNGDGSFGSAIKHPASQAAVSLAVGDFNGDGILDLAVVCAAPAVPASVGFGGV